MSATTSNATQGAEKEGRNTAPDNRSMGSAADTSAAQTPRQRLRQAHAEQQPTTTKMLHRPGPRDKPFRDEADWAESGHLRRQDDFVEKTLGGGAGGGGSINGHLDGGVVKERLLSFHVDGSLAGPAAGTSSGPSESDSSSAAAGGLGGTLSPRDKRALALLVALYLLQGIPVGLAFGSIPFLLRAKLSYSQIGIFTLCTYPYSLKLLWSPIVDSIFSPKLGRRKSWIIPIQTIVGIMFWWLGSNVQQMMEVVSRSLCRLFRPRTLYVLIPAYLRAGRARRPSPDRALFHPRLFRCDPRCVFTLCSPGNQADERSFV